MIIRLQFWLLHILVYSLSKLPFWVLYRISDLGFFLVYRVFGYRREVVRHNLALSFPERAKEELLKIEKDYYHHLCDLIVETLKVYTISDRGLAERVRLSSTILNVPGSYQGWDPASETTVIYSREANDSYEGFLAFPDAGTAYKFAKGSWADNWGDTGADGTLDPGGDDIVANEPGMYMFTADLAALTYTAEKTDWGLIGSATPDAWDADQDMTLDQATGTWAITLDLIEGEIKFRSNDDWGLNFGDTGANGSLERDGDNIVIGEAGNYTIELMLNVADYTYTVTKN
ncbi:MAG: SusF/SusE family outer membrane protein [Bacteroidota bacterium]